MSHVPPGPIDHVAHAVADLDTSIDRFEKLLGARLEHREIVVAQGVEVAFLELEGRTRLELLAPTSADTPVGRFLARRGEGLHHVCVVVSNLQETLDALTAAGIPTVDERPRRGARGHLVAFLHPKAANGLLVELMEG